MSSTSYHSTRPVIADSELPAQTAVTNGMALISNGATSSWNYITAMIGTNPGQVPPASVHNAILPPQSGNDGRVLTTDGVSASWQDPVGAAAPTPAPVFFITADSVVLNEADFPDGSTLVVDPIGETMPQIILTDAGNTSYPDGTVLHFVQYSWANLQFVSQAEATIAAKNGADRTDGTIYAHATMKKLEATTWLLYGDVISPPY